MSESKHTPGPWRFLEEDDHAEEHNACHPLTICDPANNDMANIYSEDDATVSIPREQAVANAHLIAAAPELLQALRRSAEGWANAVELGIIHEQYRTTATVLRDEARAAIAKAEGRS